MSVQLDWEANNERYLAAALEWLRLLLWRRAEQVTPETKVPHSGNPFRREDAPREHVTETQIEAAAKAVETAESVNSPPALIQLSHRLGLSPFERSVLLLCAAMELDTTIAGRCALANGNPNRPYPTFALASVLFNDPPSDFTTAERPLRYWRLIEIHQPGAQPLMTSALQLDERVLHYIKGAQDKLDERLSKLVSPIALDDGEPLPPSHQQAVLDLMAILEGSVGTMELPIVQLLGTDGLTKQLLAQRVANMLGLVLFRLTSEWLPSAASDLENFIRLWRRESKLLPIGLYLEVKNPPSEDRGQGIQRLLEEFGGLLFLDTPERWGELMRASVLVQAVRPTTDEQELIWEELVGEESPGSPAELANQFNFSFPTIKQISQTALYGDLFDLDVQLWDNCLMYARQRLDTLAQRVEAKAQWDELILPQEAKDLLRQIVSQVQLRNTVYRDWGFPQRTSRGLGLTALFAGESGTGKTMAAEVLANKLRLNLYKIDLSTVVSKYIGETEKNLRALFDAAEYGGVILFFDEADALFGKRSEVKDSHDRYANIEINYLLQRMETFQGLAILATNMKSALDTAFLRRLRFVVNFPFPGKDERRKIWENAFPASKLSSPSQLDFDWLARLNLTGGNIQTIVVNAAFVAAQRHEHINMDIVLKMAKAEFLKLEKPINEADFQWQKAAVP